MAKVYTNGVYIDDELDHEAKIAESIEKGDYAGAAYYEKRRNAKIDYLGLDYDKTYRYIDKDGNALYGDSDLNSLGDVSKKGSGTSQSTAINGIMNGIMNMPKFSYDAQKDPVYQQYKAQAEESAKRATEDTMASYAGMTGGVPSSYAVTAAHQSGERYRRSADEMIPELYQLAYGMYADEKADKYNQLNALMALDNMEYSRQRDAIGDEQWQANYDRGIFESDRAFDYGVEQDKLSQENFDKQFSSQERAGYFTDAYNLAASGNIPPQEWMDKAGLYGMTGQDLVEGIRNNEKWLLDLKAQNEQSTGGVYQKPAEGDSINENKVQAILTKHIMGKDLTTSEMELLIEAGYEYDANEDTFVLVEETSVDDSSVPKDTKALENDLMSQPDVWSRKARILSWLEIGVIDDDTAIEIASKFGIDLESEYGL